jgi:hypothetical protein
MGWPKGVKRGPRKPKPTPPPLPEPEPEPFPARYDAEAVPFVPQVQTPGGADPELERYAVEAAEQAEKARRRPATAKRRPRQGVTIDGRWFACQTAILAGDRFLLLDGEIETRVPVEGVKKLEFTGVSLQTVANQPQSEVGEVRIRGGHSHSGSSTPNLRVVEDVNDFVNVDPERERRIAEQNARRNEELEALMGPDLG